MNHNGGRKTIKNKKYHFFAQLNINLDAAVYITTTISLSSSGSCQGLCCGYSLVVPTSCQSSTLYIYQLGWFLTFSSLMKASKKTKSLNQPTAAKVTWERYSQFVLKGESVIRHKINVIVVCVNLCYLATGICNAVHGMCSFYAWRTSGLARSSLSIESRLYAVWCNRFYNQETWR